VRRSKVDSPRVRAHRSRRPTGPHCMCDGAEHSTARNAARPGQCKQHGDSGHHSEHSGVTIRRCRGGQVPQ
jgi:hypothetical protein